MKIKQIVDKVITEADVNKSKYTTTERLVDIHQVRLELNELKMQVAPYDNVKPTKDEVLVAGDQTFTRTITHKDIVSIEYRVDANDDWRCLDKAKNCEGGTCGSPLGKMRYSYDTDTIYIWDGEVGNIRITYSLASIVEWVDADYAADTKSPDELDEVYHALLWMTLVMRHAGYYSKERYEQIAIEYNRLYDLYISHIQRNAELDMEVTGNEPSNNR